MVAFPALKTGAVNQYPLDRTTRFRTQSVQFLDGSQQKFRLFGAGLGRWLVKLDVLDDQELAAVAAFVQAQGSSIFAFTDPTNGQTSNKCVIGGDSFESIADGESLARMQIVIEEVA